MLSVIDLVEAGTLSRPLACWLLARVVEGSSWLVGAVPGGAGKTTIMSALLTMLPEGERVRLTNPGTGWEKSGPGECVVCYEISPGNYDAYQWGEDVRRLCELGRSGCRIVSNLHADTLDQARSQVVGECGASPEAFSGFGLFLPVTVSRRTFSFGRRVEAVYRLADGGVIDGARVGEVSAEQSRFGPFIDLCLSRDWRRCAEVRQAWLHWLAGNQAAT